MEVKRKKATQNYKTANYYARILVISLLLWFTSIFVLYLSGYSTQVANALGRTGQIVSLTMLFLLCLAIGYVINKLTWKYLRVNRL